MSNEQTIPRIGVIGACGRMGRMLLLELHGNKMARLSGGIDRAENPNIGKDIGTFLGLPNIGITIGNDTAALFNICDIVIDFSMPENSTAVARMAFQQKKSLVIGTTGFSSFQEKIIYDAASAIPIVWSANYSLGVNMLSSMVKKTASLLGAELFDIEIVEMHHRHKIDAPSGTAIALGKAAAAGRKVSLSDVGQKNRNERSVARKMGEIGFSSLRGGDVVGDHTVIFAADGERIELSHKASSRQIFARGAVQAAIWLHTQQAGLYSMSDVLGLS